MSLPRWRWWFLPAGVLGLALVWIVGVRVLLLLSGPPRADFVSQMREGTRRTGERILSFDPRDSTFTILHVKTRDTMFVNAEDYRHRRMRRRSHLGRNATLYLEGTQDLFGHRLPPGDQDVFVDGGGLENAPAWVPRYPGARAVQGLAVRENGMLGGAWSFDTPDSMERVVRYFEAIFRDSGLSLGRGSASRGGGTRWIELHVESPDHRRQAIVEVRPSPRGATHAEVDWRVQPLKR